MTLGDPRFWQRSHSMTLALEISNSGGSIPGGLCGRLSQWNLEPFYLLGQSVGYQVMVTSFHTLLGVKARQSEPAPSLQTEQKAGGLPQSVFPYPARMSQLNPFTHNSIALRILLSLCQAQQGQPCVEQTVVCTWLGYMGLPSPEPFCEDPAASAGSIPILGDFFFHCSLPLKKSRGQRWRRTGTRAGDVGES